jgi:hypothetical protein
VQPLKTSLVVLRSVSSHLANGLPSEIADSRSGLDLLLTCMSQEFAGVLRNLSHIASSISVTTKL